jgi:hypothetical protein
MRTINNMLTSFELLKVEDIAALSLSQHTEIMAELNREQMLKGLNAEDKPLAKYRDDPYFKSQKHAIAYENWKAKIDTGHGKPKEIMNFYIVGKYHSSLTYSIENYQIVAKTSFLSDIEEKYSKLGGVYLALSPTSKEALIKNHLKETFLKNIYEAI